MGVRYLRLLIHSRSMLSRMAYIVGNKSKGWIPKRMFQENKARQIFRKANISYPLIRIRTCAYQGVKNVLFSEILACFIFLKHPFPDSPFCLIMDDIYLKKAIFNASKIRGAHENLMRNVFMEGNLNDVKHCFFPDWQKKTPNIPSKLTS